MTAAEIIEGLKELNTEDRLTFIESALRLVRQALPADSRDERRQRNEPRSKRGISTNREGS